MADINFNCLNCGQKIEAPEEMVGMTAECPTCKCEIQVRNQHEPKPALLAHGPLASCLAPGLGGSQANPNPTFIAAKCPGCGGELRVPEDREQVKCMYCGGTVIIRQAVQLVAGVNVANLMELAKAAATAGNPREAYDYYTRVLEHEPRNPTAWVGKGEAAGWMSTVKDIKTTEMIAAFNKAISYAPESEQPALRKHCAESINKVTSACYSICRAHADRFAKVGNTWGDYIERCGLLMSALMVGNKFDPNNKTTIENIIHISEDNIKGMRFSVGRFGLMENRVGVSAVSAAV
jgi:DNA-directed RNA polymerase subunit RPC12/RpoP